MLSVLLPTYNCPVEKLVIQLSTQLQNENVDWEIRCYEDGSSIENYELNKQSIAHLPHVIHFLQEKNSGRAAIRNKLAMDATYPIILFIDSDMQCISSTYISDYLKHINDADAIYGGVSYNLVSPESDKILRWKYGHQREMVKAGKRELKPYLSLKTCNLLIKKEVILSNPFDERLKKYGHEDTLHALKLSKQNVSVKHIDNELQHLGIEETDVFLSKTKMAMQNLALIMNDPNSCEQLHDITIVKFYSKIKKYHISNFLLFAFFMAEPLIIFNLKSKYPFLFMFDAYKLGYLIKACNEM